MKGICFIEPLFHKVVKGEKTQTRRMIVSRTGYFQVESRNGVIFDIWQTDDNEWCGDNLVPVNPKYKVGEKVYLKEPHILYQEDYQESRLSQSGIQYAYKFGSNLSIEEITGKSDSKWNNKLFMPESAARYFIEITAVRAERLQDITEADCIKEGIDRIDFPAIHFGIEEGEYFNWLGNTPQEAYASLIDKINGKGTWEENPFVWVYDFKLVK